MSPTGWSRPAALVASAGTELIPMTAPRGVPYIATRAEAAIGSAVMLEMLAEKRGTFRAAVCAAFGDPGLGGARELFDFPIVGMAEAAMLIACTLGRSFAIVSFAKALEPWFAEIVAWHGLSGRCAAIRMLDAKVHQHQRRGGRDGSSCSSTSRTKPSPTTVPTS